WPTGLLRQIGFPVYGIDAVRPPSTGIAWPFTYDASSLARNNPIAASSCGWPGRLSGLSWPILSWVPRSLARSNTGLVIPVSIRPGQTALMRTPVPESEYAVVWTRLMTPALLAPYGCPLAPDLRPATEVVQTIEPDPCLVIYGIECLM